MVLIKRGKCSFSQKIKSAEAIGASVVIVANYENGADEKIVTTKDKNSGVLNLHIPLLEISYHDAKKIIESE
jgi:hypothetical protein